MHLKNWCNLYHIRSSQITYKYVRALACEIGKTLNYLLLKQNTINIHVNVAVREVWKSINVADLHKF